MCGGSREGQKCQYSLDEELLHGKASLGKSNPSEKLFSQMLELIDALASISKANRERAGQKYTGMGTQLIIFISLCC